LKGVAEVEKGNVFYRIVSGTVLLCERLDYFFQLYLSIQKLTWWVALLLTACI